MPASTFRTSFLAEITTDQIPLLKTEKPRTPLRHVNGAETRALPELRNIEDLPQEMICHVMDCILYTDDVAPLESLAAFISSSPKIYASFVGYRQAMMHISWSETGQERTPCYWSDPFGAIFEPRREKWWWDTMQRASKLRALLNQHSDFDINLCKFKIWESNDWKKMPLKAWVGYEIICALSRSTSDDPRWTRIAAGRLDGHQSIRKFLDTLTLPEIEEQKIIWRQIFKFYLRLFLKDPHLFTQIEARCWAARRLPPDTSLSAWLFIVQALTKLGVGLLRKIASASSRILLDAIDDVEPVILKKEE